MTERLSPEAQNSFRADLVLLGLRHRRGHDLRRTFITLAQVDGARRDLLETITHGPRGNIINVYTTFPWPALCAEVAKLKIEEHRWGHETGVARPDLFGPRSRRRTAIACYRSCYRVSETGGTVGEKVRPQRDSNPRSCLERALSWAGLDDGVPTVT